ncbi:MAG: murein biosynthesis integral membrane protein MurJ [Candidatus Buchananbacteria bacterium]|nr:murein biosynthesis integral membrane protein MurJ [Candidatus Buchananbacteria bacterium]
MLRRLLSAQSQSVTAAAVLIGGLSLASRLLGVVRDRILAGQFGAGTQLDVYYAAFRIPDTMYNLVILGTISAGLIPVFTSLLSRDQKDAAWRLIDNLFTVGALFLVALGGFLWLVMPSLVPLITPGFDQSSLASTIMLSRIMLLSPILMGISAVAGAVLQSHRRFLAFSLAPIMYNVGIIIGALLLAPVYGLVGLAWGVILGALLHLIVQSFPLTKIGYHFKPRLEFHNRDIRTVLLLMGPRTAALLVSQLQLVAATIIASALAAGSLAVYNLAINLQSFPLGLFSVSLAVAVLPVLASAAAKKDYEGLITTLSSTIRQMWFFVVPAAVLLYVLRAHVVRVVLGSGNFDWVDTRLTAAILGMFCLSMFAQGVLPLLYRAFYALQNTKTPLLVGVVALVINISSIYGAYILLGSDTWFRFTLTATLRVSDLIGVADVRVLALPFGLLIASVVELLLLVVLLRRRLGRLDARKLWASSWRIATAAVGAGLCAYGTLQILGETIITETFLGILLHGSVAGTVGMLSYVVFGYLLSVEELFIFAASLRKKLFKQAIASEAIATD